LIEGNSKGRKTFVFFNTCFLIVYSLTCFLPFIHVLAISFSSRSAAAAGIVGFWPVEFTTSAYGYVMSKAQFLESIRISVERVLLGSSINMILVILLAYPLSKEVNSFRWRTIYVWFFVFTIFFGGGLIPWYITIKNMGLIDSIWALVLPGAVQVFSITILLNFFRGLPKELEESAFMDGAGHFTILTRIFLPASTPALATLLLFSIVGHWNSWFDGLILMNTPAHYPLQTYLQTIIVQSTNSQLMNNADVELLKLISEHTVKSAQIFLGALPILIVYPFLQKYFVKGIVLGSVKG
jgi:putative aldouronate transport system permease protein